MRSKFGVKRGSALGNLCGRLQRPDEHLSIIGDKVFVFLSTRETQNFSSWHFKEAVKLSMSLISFTLDKGGGGVRHTWESRSIEKLGSCSGNASCTEHVHV